MPKRNNLCTPFSISTSAIPGSIGSALSGAVMGASQAGQASTKVMQETDLADRDSLLKALDILCHANEDRRVEQTPGADLFPEELQNILHFIQRSAASSAKQVLLAPTMTASHLSQLPLDIKASIEGILHSIKDVHPFLQTKAASTLDIAMELQERKSGFSANCRALYDQLDNISDQLNDNINDQFAHKKRPAKTHAQLAISTATTAAGGSLGTASLIALMVDAIGSSFREISASALFSRNESATPKELNVYQAFSNCCQSFSKASNSNESLHALLKLEKAVLDFGPATNMLNNHGVSSPSLSVFVRMLTAEPFIKSLITVNASAIALSEAQHALTKEENHFSQDTQQSAAKASLIRDCSGGDALNHSENVSVFCDRFDEAINQIDQDLQVGANYKAIRSTAKSTVRGESALVIASSLITGFAGLISRELSGTIDFSKNDKGSNQESKEVLQTRRAMSGADLDKLMSRVCALQERLERCKELGVSAPVAIGISQAITSGSLISALNVVAGMYSALSELRTLTESPSIPLQLDEAEKLKAADYVNSAIESNRDTVGLVGTAAVSDNLSLHRKLETVMNKLVLTNRVSNNFIQPNMDRPDLDASAKASIAFSQGNSSGFLLGSLGVLALVGLESGIGIEVLLAASRNSLEAKRLSDGVDRCEMENGFKSNISFVSNGTRLSEQSMASSSILQTGTITTNLLAESAFSRSLLVALCNSGALKEMLRQLIRREQERLIPAAGFLDSALTSDALMSQLEGNILQVLDEAERGHNPIPGLHVDIASNLASATNATLAAALGTHSLFISPILKSIVAAQKASVIADDLKNEALSADSAVGRALSSSSNIIQAFTDNFKLEIRGFAKPIKHSSLADSSDSLFVESMVSACAVSLLCEELFEICLSRSLTLLDRDKVAASANQSTEQSQINSGQSSDAVAEDSGIGQENSVSHVISALRLTLSHLGVSLGNFASELKKYPELLQADLQLHSSQRKLIDSMASAFAHCSSALLSGSAVLSNLPMSSAGSIESLREVIHSFDHTLVLRQTHSSEDCTESSGSDSSLLTGMATDCLSNIFSAATKLLFKASVLGLDTSLSIAKIMEILCLHPRPEEALTLELQGLSQPNGCSANLNEQTQCVLVATGIGSASVTIATETNLSQSSAEALRVLQAAVDHQIERVALLEDEEEPNALGLQAFYRLLIAVLANSVTEEDSQDLVLRLHRGGIALSGYHSSHGGIGAISHGDRSNRLLSNDRFLDCDDAATLLTTFINKAFNEERLVFDNLLNKMKSALQSHGKLSAKSEQRWEFIVNSVFERLREENMRNRFFHPGDVRRNQDKWMERKHNLLSNWETIVTEPEKMADLYEPIP